MAPLCYDEITSPFIRGGDLTFVDFLPKCQDPGNYFRVPTYETFRGLIDQANRWLLENPRWEAKTCESVEFREKGGKIVTEKMEYHEDSENRTSYFRGLRLWLVPRVCPGNTAQQIGYVNLVPQQSENAGFIKKPVYESLSEVLQRFNDMIKMSQIKGHVINVESQNVKEPNTPDWDADQTLWSEVPSRNRKYIFIIRVFFEISQSPIEEIGAVDFVPEKISEGGIFSRPKYESFSNVVEKASSWCSENSSAVRICNVQSFKVKVKEAGHELDTHRMHYTERSTITTYYMNILRIAYVRLPPVLSDGVREKLAIEELTWKVFQPVQLRSGLCSKFETLEKTRFRMETWVRAAGARIISAQTSAIRLQEYMHARRERGTGVEKNYTYSSSGTTESGIFIIQLFLNGAYPEPPARLLPPIPRMQNRDCCSIQ